MNDYYYLTVIYQLGNPNLGDVAKELKLTKPSISALVQRLTKNDLIKKIQSDEDKRVFHLSLTEKGLRIVQGDDELYRTLAGELENMLTEKQFADINCLLTMLADKIKKNSDKDGKEL
jgi:DNA-binding MarR family transcriptional regulator